MRTLRNICIITVIIIVCIYVGVTNSWDTKNKLAKKQLIEQLPYVEKICMDNLDSFESLAFEIKELSEDVECPIVVGQEEVTWYNYVGEENTYTKSDDLDPLRTTKKDLIEKIQINSKSLRVKLGIDTIYEAEYFYKEEEFPCIVFSIWSEFNQLSIAWKLLYAENGFYNDELIIPIAENWYLSGEIHWPV